VITPGLHHVGLVSGDAKRTAAFYGEVLGLAALEPAGEPGAGEAAPDTAAPLAFGAAPSAGGFLAFQVTPDARKGAWGVGGIHHVALAVEDVDALLRWKRRLADHGVGASGPIDRGYFTSLYFQDPDGQILELATRGPGYAIDEPVDALGERFITPPESRIRGHRDEGAIARAMHPEPVPEITPAMRIGELHHVTGITDDLEAANTFWTDALGLRLVKMTVNQDDGKTKHLFWARYDGGKVAPASAMTLFGWPGSDYRARAGTGQASHVAYRMAAGETLAGWADHLAEVGVSGDTRPDPVTSGGRLRLEAPDGLRVELVADAR
jgi:glyoxalase family protein